jgi:hypothetical protein
LKFSNISFCHGCLNDCAACITCPFRSNRQDQRAKSKVLHRMIFSLSFCYYVCVQTHVVFEFLCSFDGPFKRFCRNANSIRPFKLADLWSQYMQMDLRPYTHHKYDITITRLHVVTVVIYFLQKFVFPSSLNFLVTCNCQTFGIRNYI